MYGSLEVMSNKKNSNSTIYYKIIMIISLLFCILWVSFINTKPFSDFQYYYNLSVQIANGGSWGNTYTSVGYCIILGGIFKLFGASVLKAKIFNIVLAFLNNFIFYRLLKKLDIDEKRMKIVFTIFAFFPNNIFYTSVLGTEILFTTMLLLVTNVYFGNFKYKYILLGVLTGVITIIKPFFMVFAFAVFLVELLKEKKFLHSLKCSLTIFIVSAICIAPWIYRNTKMMGQYTYVSNNDGIVLYINNNSENTFGRWMAAADVKDSLVKKEEYKKANMTEKNHMLKKEANKWIKAHRKEFLVLGTKRLVNTYFLGDDIGYSTYGSGLSSQTKFKMVVKSTIIKNIFFIPAIIYILLYSVFILYKIIKRQTETLNKFNLYITVIFYMFTTIYFVTEGQARYAFPLIFIIIYFWFYIVKYLVLLFKEFIK